MLMIRPGVADQVAPTDARRRLRSLTRALTSGGITESLYILVLLVEPLPARHRDHPGIDALGRPAAAARRPRTAPPNRCRSRSRPARRRLSLRMYAALGHALVSAKPSSPRGTIGSACRLRTEAGRPVVVLQDRCPGRRRSRWRPPAGPRRGRGSPRSAARCSIGWWVGPSSPRPIESWVQT